MQRVKVYSLAVELSNDPEQVAAAQALSLDESRPTIGLSGKNGLFGSPQWWANIEAGVINTKRELGVIGDVYAAGQDSSDIPNAFDFLSKEGGARMEGIYANDESGILEYQPGRQIELVYVMDELKTPHGTGEQAHLDIVSEVFILQ